MHILDPEGVDGVRQGRHALAARRVVRHMFHVGHVDANAGVGVADHQIADTAVPDHIVVGPADADRRGVALQDAVRHHHPLARHRSVQLMLIGAQDQRVVAAAHNAVADRHVAARPDVDAVAVRIPQIHLDLQPAHLHGFAIQQPHAPARRIQDRDIIEPDIFASDQEDVAPGDQLIVLAAPPVRPFGPFVKQLRMPVDRAASADRDVGLRHRIEHRALVAAQAVFDAPVGRGLEFRIKERVRTALQRGARLDLQPRV